MVRVPTTIGVRHMSFKASRIHSLHVPLTAQLIAHCQSGHQHFIACSPLAARRISTIWITCMARRQTDQTEPSNQNDAKARAADKKN